MLAPLGTFFLWARIGWGDGESVPETLAKIVLPMLLSCASLRLALGSRP
jgi:hypothetical protein